MKYVKVKAPCSCCLVGPGGGWASDVLVPPLMGPTFVYNGAFSAAAAAAPACLLLEVTLLVWLFLLAGGLVPVVIVAVVVVYWNVTCSDVDAGSDARC